MFFFDVEGPDFVNIWYGKLEMAIATAQNTGYLVAGAARLGAAVGHRPAKTGILSPRYRYSHAIRVQYHGPVPGKIRRGQCTGEDGTSSP